jgi:tetratricopeptide (TPR) repeat protein
MPAPARRLAQTRPPGAPGAIPPEDDDDPDMEEPNGPPPGIMRRPGDTPPLKPGARPRPKDERSECFARGEPQAVIEACSREIEGGRLRGRQLARAHIQRGMAYNRLRDERAIAELDAAIRLDPAIPAAYLQRSTAFRIQRAFDHAIADAAEAIKLNPKSPAGFFGRGAAYVGKREYEAAIADLSKAIEINPRPQFYVQRGLAYERMREADKALADYRAALELAPNHPHAKAGIARIEMRGGKK